MPVKKEITRSKLKEVKKFLPQIHPLNDRVGKIETVKTPPPTKPLDFLEVVGVNSVGEKLILRGN